MGCAALNKKNKQVIEPIMTTSKKLNEPSESKTLIVVSNEENTDSNKKITDSTYNASINPNTCQKPKSFNERIAQTPWITENFITTNIETLGEGNFGKVFGCFHKKLQKNVAIKYIFLQDEDEFNSMTKEINILQTLQAFGNVVRIMDKHIDPISHEIFIVMERGDCNLKQYIEKLKNDIKFEILLQLLADLSTGLFNAHSKNIIHSDIKPGNILVHTQNRKDLKGVQNFFVFDENLVFKLTDWGAGCSNATGKTTRLKTDMAFTTSYAAPEFLIDEEHVNFQKGDVYSLGMTFVNCCGVKFEDMRHISSIAKPEKYEKDVNEILDEIPNKYNEKLKDLLSRMLKFDRHQRIELGEAIEIIKNLNKSKDQKLEKKTTINIGPNLNENLWTTDVQVNVILLIYVYEILI